VENFVGNLGGVIAPLLPGFLISWTGSYSPAFVLAALTLVAGLAAYWFVVGRLNPALPAEFHG
jgi:nitrate/nitrite transporter NarK